MLILDLCEDHNHCIENAITSAKCYCNSNKIQFTPLRERVLRKVWESHKSVKAYDLINNMGSKNEPVKPPIVYRVLDFLLNIGLIHRIDSLNAFVGCQHPFEHENCYLLICENCAVVEESCSDKFTSEINKISQHRRFSPTHTVLEIHGYCAACR